MMSHSGRPSPPVRSVTSDDRVGRPDGALVALGRAVRAEGYRFITPTPLTHSRVLARNRSSADPLHALFGWSRLVPRSAVPARWLRLMAEAQVLEERGGAVRSTVRFSSIADQLFVHSAYPTTGVDAVFFGPDTYRFARAVRAAAERFRPLGPCRIFDVGCGSGAGGMVAVQALGPIADAQLILSDVNRLALRFAAINAQINDIAGARTVESDVLRDVDGHADLIVSNPPYLVDPAARAYRHGGGCWGYDLSLRIAVESLGRLAPGGRLVLYTGAAVVDGRDLFRTALTAALDGHAVSFTYEELDPDVFGEELETPPYDAADRIAAVLVTINAPEDDRERT